MWLSREFVVGGLEGGVAWWWQADLYGSYTRLLNLGLRQLSAMSFSHLRQPGLLVSKYVEKKNEYTMASFVLWVLLYSIDSASAALLSHRPVQLETKVTFYGSTRTEKKGWVCYLPHKMLCSQENVSHLSYFSLKRCLAFVLAVCRDISPTWNPASPLLSTRLASMHIGMIPFVCIMI